jgi:glycosyltransferase involved in cell wall biosynthesis
MSNNIWFIISYFANIKGACQSEWIEDRMRALAKSGIRPVLISSFCGDRYNNMVHVRALSFSPADLKYELDCTLKRKGFTGGLFKFLRILFFFPLYPLYFVETKILNIYGECRWSWIPWATLIGLVVVLKTKPAVIYSTGGPASAHIVALVISKITKISLMVELQDPFVGDDIGRNALSKRGLAYIEKMIFVNSSKVIFCTQTATDSAAIRNNSDKAVCIYPGSSIEVPGISTIDNHKILKFIYLGSLYQTRNLDCFMEALSLIFKENPELKECLSLDVYGNINNDIRSRINSFEYSVIKLHGVVSREQAFRKALESDVLLLVQNVDDRSITTIPFKIYDYLLLNRKILGLVYKNKELEAMITDYGHLSVPADKSQEIKKAIMLLIDNWRKGNLTKNIKRSELTGERAARQMISLSEKLLANR